MNVARGDIVLLDSPYSGGTGSKVRPAIVIQNDRDNLRLVNTIIAQITSHTGRALEPTQFLIELASAEGQVSGLRQDSVVNAANLFTIDRSKLLRRLGSLPAHAMEKVDACLKAALNLTSP